MHCRKRRQIISYKIGLYFKYKGEPPFSTVETLEFIFAFVCMCFEIRSLIELVLLLWGITYSIFLLCNMQIKY